MIGAIADDVGERIAQKVDQLPVEFGVGALNREVDIFAQFRAQIAHKARQFGKNAANGLHAGAHDAVL